EKLDRLLVDGIPPSMSLTKTTLYKRAVYGRAHSELLPEFATQDRRKEGDNAAIDEPQQAARFLAQSNKDVSQLLGRSANGIDSI
uniref:head completion/stabilization protein n=1 Tax=Vibrio sp. 624788 TaxID=1234362 RepID=UPI00037EF9FE